MLPAGAPFNLMARGVRQWGTAEEEKEGAVAVLAVTPELEQASTLTANYRITPRRARIPSLHSTSSGTRV